MFSQWNKFQFLHNSTEQVVDDAPDTPPTFFITGVVIFSFLFVFILICFVFPFTEKLVEFQEKEVTLGMGNEERLTYLAKEKTILSSYEKIDATHYQIPIEKAMALVVQSQGNLIHYENFDTDKNNMNKVQTP